jgi:hypothetical protein
MNSVVISGLSFLGIFGMALLGIRLRRTLPEHHFTEDSKDTVRLGMGMIATMTALLLGLMIASAKGSYDTQRNEVIQTASKLDYLDRWLALYGPETAEAREQLRRVTEAMIQQWWPTDRAKEAQTDNFLVPARTFYRTLEQLTPQNDVQRSAKAEVLEAANEISRTRWLLFAQRDSSIASPLLLIVIIWLGTIFFSYGLFAPSNGLVILTMMVVALSLSSAIFLILELDQPFNGVVQLSSEPMRNALKHLEH